VPSQGTACLHPVHTWDNNTFVGGRFFWGPWETPKPIPFFGGVSPPGGPRGFFGQKGAFFRAWAFFFPHRDETTYPSSSRSGQIVQPRRDFFGLCPSKRRIQASVSGSRTARSGLRRFLRRLSSSSASFHTDRREQRRQQSSVIRSSLDRLWTLTANFADDHRLQTRVDVAVKKRKLIVAVTGQTFDFSTLESARQPSSFSTP